MVAVISVVMVIVATAFLVLAQIYAVAFLLGNFGLPLEYQR